jgi:hypothetical protein
MKAISIDYKLLTQIHRALHEAGKINLATRLVDQIRLLQIEHVENLVCVKHAAKLRRNDRTTIRYHVAHGNLRCYNVCCRYFVSRKQVKELPQGYQRSIRD